MPPWHADPKYGHFANDSRLSARGEEDDCRLDCSRGAEGDPKDLPAPPTFATGWRIPKPDVVFTIPKPFKVKATGTIEYQFFVIDTGFTEDKWIQAAEVRPSCRAVVHHVLVFIQPQTNRWFWVPKRSIPSRGAAASERRWGRAARRLVVRGRR